MITRYLLIVLFSVSAFSFSQNLHQNVKSDSLKNIKDDESVFFVIEDSFREADINKISKYFGQQTYFSLLNGISGYYSSNQAYYVLQDFYNLYKVTAFKFDHIKSDKTTPYATGKYNYDYKGKRGVAQVYISLKKTGNNWIITQLTIN